ncbi:MAG: cytochrome c oxidase subunit II [Phycisphaerales bacterium]|nr:cytochrome c oxidase subunit II [Phycisphaerales bacterium]
MTSGWLSILDNVAAQGLYALAQTAEPEGWWTRLWFRHSGSTFARSSDQVYDFIFWVSAAFFVPMMVLMVYWGIKYRRRAGVPAQPSPSHNTPLEIAWSVVPTLLMLVMFIWGFQVYIHKFVPPVDAETVYVTAKKWDWEVTYPNGVTPRERTKLTNMDRPVYAFPAGKPIKLVLTSTDVIHSFYIPDFRIKRDCLPNRYTTLWFEAKAPTHTLDDDGKTVKAIDGTGYFLWCAEYCGDFHSQMGAKIAVLSQADYAKWLETQQDTSGIDLVSLGESLHKIQGCATCHSVDGSKGTGPSWKNIWGQTHKFDLGKSSDKAAASRVVDENYIRDSVLTPGLNVVEGYPNQMPAYPNLKPREMIAIITYIQYLSDAGRSEALNKAKTEKTFTDAAAKQGKKPEDLMKPR